MTFDLKKAVHHSVLASPLWRCTRGSEQGQRNYGSYLCWQKKAECESLQSAKLGRYLEKYKILINSFEFFSVPPFLSSTRVTIHAERSLKATCICTSVHPPVFTHIIIPERLNEFSCKLILQNFTQKSYIWFIAMFSNPPNVVSLNNNRKSRISSHSKGKGVP
jgi:hypothetical protein